jgi:Thrombospondin type 3 repeat
MRAPVLLLLLAAALAALPGGLAAAHPEDYADVDHDGVREAPYGPDNCPPERGPSFNPQQTDTDRDGRGDLCDDDGDGDATPDAADGCALIANPTQTDVDRDGRGDVCDEDDDGDGVADARDNCRVVPNSDQRDADGADPGDACPGGAAGRVDPADDATPPRATVRAAARHRLEEVAAGVPVAVTCSEACTIAAELEGGGGWLGSAAARLGAAGRTFVFVRVARARARRVTRVRVVAADVTGNRTVVTRPVRIAGRASAARRARSAR